MDTKSSKDNNTISVMFTGVKWKKNRRLPSSFMRNIRSTFFTTTSNGETVHLSGKDLKDVLASYLDDELGECPEDFSFEVLSKKSLNKMLKESTHR